MRRLLPLFLLCIALFFARPAEAVRAYADGGWQSNGTLCPVTGNAVTVLQTYAGYFTDPNEPFPRAGDLAYVHAVGINVSPCVNDAVGFEFFPPLGANLAISPTNRVYCIVGKLDGSITPYNVPNDANGGCSQTPSIGTNGGYYFGYSALPPGWYLEIQVPVVFTQQLFGIAGPNTHRLTVATSSAYGTVFPYQPVTVFPAAAQPQTLTVSKNGTGAGTVTSSPASINCGTICSTSFASGSSVTLTATPEAGSNFSGWSGGGCVGTGTCTVTMNSAQNITAQFTRQIGSLSVTLGGLPAGTVVTLGITGPNGFNITNTVMTGTGFNLSDVVTGTYTVTAPATIVGATTYNAAPQSAVVNFGATATINIIYISAPIPQTAKSDFNGDGKSDVILRNKVTGENIGWLMNGLFVSTAALLPTVGDLNWEIKGVGDFDGDGKADVLWRNKVTGENVGWLMNGLTLLAPALLPRVGDLNWEIKGVGDFDRDGKADVLWRNKVTGENAGWLMNGLTLSSSAMLPRVGDLDWEIKGAGDLDGDGKADVLWRNKVTGENVGWLMNGLTLSTAALLPRVRDLNWEIKGVGDLDGDGKADVLWRNKVTGENVGWLMNGLTLFTSALLPTLGDLNWEIKGAGDINGDGKADVLWRNKVTGQSGGWLMNGLAITTAAPLRPILDPNWEIVGGP